MLSPLQGISSIYIYKATSQWGVGLDIYVFLLISFLFLTHIPCRKITGRIVTSLFLAHFWGSVPAVRLSFYLAILNDSASYKNFEFLSIGMISKREKKATSGEREFQKVEKSWLSLLAYTSKIMKFIMK